MNRRRYLAVAVAAAVCTPLLLAPSVRAEDHYTKLTDVRLEMDDGVVLVGDVYVPTAADGDGDGLYPCVVEVTPYRKELRNAEGASFLPPKGIALIEIDARGTGGSEGEYDIVFSVREQHDVVNWIDWAATRATKDGRPLAQDGSNKLCESTVGLFGGSYSGILQYLVASLPQRSQGNLPAASRYLSAIAPQRAFGDLYRDIVYHGGVAIGSFAAIWSAATTAFYSLPPTSGNLTAYSDHLSKNDALLLEYYARPYIDDVYESDDSEKPFEQRIYEDSSALARIENLEVPTLHLAGWFDLFTRGQLMTFQRAHELEATFPGRGPNFLIAGPWNHSGTHFVNPENFSKQLADWYLYWLEGEEAGLPIPDWIANGFDGKGARVRYFQMVTGDLNEDGPDDGRWIDVPTWPSPDVDVRRLYLRDGGELSPGKPGDAGSDSYVYNPTAGTAEILSRWDNGAGTPQPAWDQRSDGFKGLSYETSPLEKPLALAGPLALRFWASTDGPPGDPGAAKDWPGYLQFLPPYHDTDWIVKMSDVAPDGSARLITSGYLRASHRVFDAGESEYLDGELVGPLYKHTLAALRPPEPGKVIEYVLELLPTAKTFERGHRLHIDIYSADTPNHLTLVKPAVNTIFMGGRRASYLAVPVTRSVTEDREAVVRR